MAGVVTSHVSTTAGTFPLKRQVSLKGAELACERNARGSIFKTIRPPQDIFRPAVGVIFVIGGVVSRDYAPREELGTGDVVVARELHGFQRKFDDVHGFPGFEVLEVVDIVDILVGMVL